MEKSCLDNEDFDWRGHSISSSLPLFSHIFLITPTFVSLNLHTFLSNARHKSTQCSMPLYMKSIEVFYRSQHDRQWTPEKRMTKMLDWNFLIWLKNHSTKKYCLNSKYEGYDIPKPMTFIYGIFGNKRSLQRRQRWTYSFFISFLLFFSVLKRLFAIWFPKIMFYWRRISETVIWTRTFVSCKRINSKTTAHSSPPIPLWRSFRLLFTPLPEVLLSHIRTLSRLSLRLERGQCGGWGVTVSVNSVTLPCVSLPITWNYVSSLPSLSVQSIWRYTNYRTIASKSTC